MTVDDEQRLFTIAGGGNGVLYAARADGTLQWFCNTGWQTGAASWANGGNPKAIGSGWNDFVDILAGLDGTLFGVYGNGDVMRYQYHVTNQSTGDGYWDNGGTGVKVGSGFNRFPRLFGGPDGVIWGVDGNGGLWRSQYTTGAMSTPVQVGSGFQDCRWLGADAGGVIYGAHFGTLVWWRYTGSGWCNGGRPIAIGDGSWDALTYKHIAPGGRGLLYLVRPDDDLTTPGHDNALVWLYLTNYQTVATDGTGRFANNGSGLVVGSGFTIEHWAPLQGYADPPSVTPGGIVHVCASTTFATVDVSVIQLAPGCTPQTVQAAVTVPGQLQVLPAGYQSDGCGWSSLLDITVPAGWPPGLYAARLTGRFGQYRDLPFVVKPASPTARLAVILATATHQAYNAWGGHNAYVNDPAGVPLTFSFDRPSYTATTEPTGKLDFELYSDLLLLRWLTCNGFSYDVYTDQDWHANPGLLSGYAAVALGSHPEYVTAEMRQSLVDYLAAGGRLVYTGGNGLYEPLLLSTDLSQATWRTPDGGRHYYRTQGLPESQILGVAYNGAGWATFAPYKVVNDHPILAGTGLVVGSLFGATGYNHAASGMEFDTAGSLDGSATGGQVIAVGQNTTGAGATMVWIDQPSGGWVFSAGSLTFNGSLAADSALSAVFRNVIGRAVA